MNAIARLSTLMILAVALLTMASCSGQQNTTETNSNASLAPAPQTSPGAPSNIAKNATITADPNPIKVCDGSGLGITKLTYSAKGPSQVEVRIASPNNGLLAHTGPVGTATSGKWVSNGTVFYLQDVSDGKPLTPENTLATVTVGVTTQGCN
jgi:hypothetical protein